MTDLLYRNRRLLVLTLVLIIATGGFAYLQLPRQEDPTLTPRFGLILTRLPGATAQRVEALVTEKIERNLREIEEVKEIASTSRSGVSAINVELKDTVTEVDRVWSRVRDRLSDVRGVLPREASAPELKDREETDTYTLIAALRWNGTKPANYAVLRRLAEDVRDTMRDQAGTSFVQVFGAPAEEIRVDVDRRAAARLGLTPADIAARIGAADAKVTAGLVRGTRSDMTVEVSGEIESLERIRSLPLRSGADGRVLRLRDVARVTKAIADPPRELALIDGAPGVAIAARMVQGERTDQWAARMRTSLAAYGAELPERVSLDVIFDQSRYVESRLEGLQDNLLLGIGLVVLVIFVMMGWRSALVVGAALPLASLMVLAGLRLLGAPIHQMSITGLIIALGLLIDNAIIMVDEVSHHMRAGRSAGASIRASVRFLVVPLVGSTITTILAFMPMVVVPGPMGEFIGTIAVSVILALISSYLLALTVVPALVGILGLGPVRRTRWWRDGISLGRLAHAYRASLRFMTRHPFVATAFAVALPIAGFLMADRLEEQFFPPADRDQVRVQLRLPPQASIAETLALATALDEEMRARPEVRRVHWFIGRNAPKFYYNLLGGMEGSPNFAEALVQLDSHVDVTAKARALQEALDEAQPQAQILVRALEQGPPFDAPIEMRIYGPDLDTLRRLGDEARSVLARVPDVTHTRGSLAGGRPKLHLRLNEEELHRSGLTNGAVAAQLQGNLEGALGGSLLEGTEEVPVRVRLDAARRRGADQIESIDLLSGRAGAPDRRTVALSAVATTEIRPEEGAITRRDGRRLNTVQGFVTAGVLPSAVLTSFRQALAASDLHLPAGYRIEFGGEEAERNRAVSYLLGSIAVLVLLMVTILVLSFRSFRLMALILTVAGLSVGLSLLALFVFGQNFGFMAIVGTMGLVGVAINDSIAVLAALQADDRVLAGDVEATVDVVFRSTRHVLATTVTTVAGFLPLLIAGGGFWPPLAISIAGGVLGASVLALFFVPAAYRLLMVRRAHARVAVAVTVAPQGA